MDTPTLESSLAFLESVQDEHHAAALEAIAAETDVPPEPQACLICYGVGCSCRIPVLLPVAIVLVHLRIKLGWGSIARRS